MITTLPRPPSSHYAFRDPESESAGSATNVTRLGLLAISADAASRALKPISRPGAVGQAR